MPRMRQFDPRFNAVLATFFVLSVVSLSGCASRAPSLLLPIGAAPAGGKTIDLLAITTRATSDVPGEIYSGQRSRDVTGRIITVSIPPNHQPGQLEWPSGGEPDIENEFAALSVETTTPEGAWDWFDEQETHGRLLIFVHGYNVRFADAVLRLAQITNDMPVLAAPVLFSWPSGGELLGYNYDKESATYARDALELVLSEAIESDSVSQITILAHSMGSWITMETLRQMAIRNGRVHEKVIDVILAAPDLDIDVFEQQFLTLGESRPFFTFIVSADDRALGLSKMLARGEQRLGAIDPSQEPYRSRIESTRGVTVIDLKDVEGGGGARHSKFSESGEMLDFVRRTLADDETDLAERTSIGEQAGAVIVTLGLGVAEISE
jgi:esterase/lipase superfamily enzyme